ncbi:MAG: FAD-dependent oxidoreductase [Oscillospiraceae bacterium]|nr:FAD-dependent oxidoreductase [Oscillospiraceae bacterium]
MSKKIVVLGAGYAGILIAKKLEKKLKGKDATITLIDKNPYHTMLTELHEVAAWRVDESSIRMDLKKIFAGRNVAVVQDNITSADYDNNTISSEGTTYPYDYLVMATGSKPTFFGVEGAKENSLTLWSYTDAVRLRDHIENMFIQAYRETDPEIKKSMLTFYIVGGGFTGVEMAGELAEYAPLACKKFEIDPGLVRIVNVDVLPRLMPFLPEKTAEKAVKRLEKMGVSVSLGTNVVRIGKNEIEVSKDGQTIVESTHTVIWGAGTEGSGVVMQSETLGLGKNSRGRVQTDSYLRSLTHPNVYVGGDNMFYIPEGEKVPVPQMVENCEACAPVIASNIVDEINGNPPQNKYKPKFHGAMVCIGGRYGQSYVGTHEKKFSPPSFISMFAKHFINIIYFFQVAGWNKVFSYIKNEFFNIRNQRSFVGGHFSNRTPVFFLVPLRLFMGIYFIYYAYRRYALGWLSESRLRDSFYNVAEQFRPAVFEFELWDQIRFSVFVAGDYMHMWLQSTPMLWFLEGWVFASSGSEIFFQTLIVLFELFVGLALLAGLFTTLAGLGVMFFSLMIMLTTGLPFGLWWLPFAGLAQVFTGGKVLSFDYYVMPWLAKKWRNINFMRKWYLYHD